jgi:hypothetical protein
VRIESLKRYQRPRDRRPLGTCHPLNAPLPKSTMSVSAAGGVTISRVASGDSRRKGQGPGFASTEWCVGASAT